MTELLRNIVGLQVGDIVRLAGPPSTLRYSTVGENGGVLHWPEFALHKIYFSGVTVRRRFVVTMIDDDDDEFDLSRNGPLLELRPVWGGLLNMGAIVVHAKNVVRV